MSEERRPKFLSTGWYKVKVDSKEMMFDFTAMTWDIQERKDGYWGINCECTEYDTGFNISQEEISVVLRKLVKGDFIEIPYRCYADGRRSHRIALIPLQVMFYDEDGTSYEVVGEAFCNVVSA
jgi:hypothetical protein